MKKVPDKESLLLYLNLMRTELEEWLKTYSRSDSASWGIKWLLPEKLPSTKCNSQKIFGQISARLRTWEVESACSHESSGTRKWNKGQIEKIGASLHAGRSIFKRIKKLEIQKKTRKWKLNFQGNVEIENPDAKIRKSTQGQIEQIGLSPPTKRNTRIMGKSRNKAQSNMIDCFFFFGCWSHADTD